MAVAHVFCGDNKRIYLNLKCQVRRMVPYLCSEAGCPLDTVIDLADVEGNLKHLDDNMLDQGYQHLQDSAKYILCSVMVDATGAKKYEVLHKNIQTIFPDFVLETERPDTPPKRSGSQASMGSSGSGTWSKVRRKSRDVRTISAMSNASTTSAKSKASNKSKAGSTKDGK